MLWMASVVVERSESAKPVKAAISTNAHPTMRAMKGTPLASRVPWRSRGVACGLIWRGGRQRRRDLVARGVGEAGERVLAAASGISSAEPEE